VAIDRASDEDKPGGGGDAGTDEREWENRMVIPHAMVRCDNHTVTAAVNLRKAKDDKAPDGSG